MSHSGKPISELGLDSLSDRFAESLSCEANKPDFRELDLGSPVSPLRTRQTATATMTSTTTTTTTTSSSSSSSGSVSGRNGPGPGHPSGARRSDSGPSNSHSGELSGSSESSPTAAESLRSGAAAARCNFKPGHARSDSGSSSPALNVLPTGNICPSGKILKTGMAMAAASGGRAYRSDVLGSGTGNYGHGSIMRGSAAAKCDAAVANQRGNIGIGGGGGGGGGRGMGGVDPEEVKRAGNEQFKRRNFADALSLYDRAIALSPGNAAYRSNRAAALTGLGRLWEAVKECEEAVRLDPNYGRAHQRLASLFLR